MEMVSACPACLTMVTHEDHLFEVKCGECGTRFNPFVAAGEGSEAPSNDLSGPGVDLGGASLGPTAMEGAAGTDYSESNAAFQDIRDFGEGLVSNEPVPKAPTPPSNGSRATPAKAPVGATSAGSAISADCLVTFADTLQGFQVDSYLTPISALLDLDVSSTNPLGPVFESLWNQAKAGGATAVLSVRWSFSPDGTKVLASGTPVRCTPL